MHVSDDEDEEEETKTSGVQGKPSHSASLLQNEETKDPVAPQFGETLLQMVQAQTMPVVEEKKKVVVRKRRPVVIHSDSSSSDSGHERTPVKDMFKTNLKKSDIQ